MVFPDGKNIDHPYANPLTHENLADLPPAVIATAGFDPIRDQGNDYAARLKAAGNQVEHYCFPACATVSGQWAMSAALAAYGLRPVGA